MWKILYKNCTKNSFLAFENFDLMTVEVFTTSVILVRQKEGLKTFYFLTFLSLILICRYHLSFKLLLPIITT